jgi:hypothetical protein
MLVKILAFILPNRDFSSDSNKNSPRPLGLRLGCGNPYQTASTSFHLARSQAPGRGLIRSERTPVPHVYDFGNIVLAAKGIFASALEARRASHIGPGIAIQNASIGRFSNQRLQTTGGPRSNAETLGMLAEGVAPRGKFSW